MIVCPTCNFKNHEGALFCEKCGTYFHGGGPLATDALRSEPASKARPSGFRASAADSSIGKALLVLTTEPEARRFIFDSQDRTALIGRNDRAARLFVDIDPAGEEGQSYGISRRHARVHYQNGIFLLEDLESLNGTHINERRLRPYLPEVLHEGDNVKLGDLSLKVSIEVRE